MNKRVLFVDDDQNLLAAFQRNLRNHFDVITVASADEALAELEKNGEFAVVVADYRMPKMNGIQFLTMAKNMAPDTVRIMLSGQADFEATIQAVNKNGLFRFLLKPCDPQELVDAIVDGLEQYRLVTGERELLEKTLSGSIKVLYDILAAVNPKAFSCSTRVLDLTKKIAKQLMFDNEWQVELTVMLSQIGSITLPSTIISKHLNGFFLNEREREMYDEHPLFGRKLLENIPRLEKVAQAIAYQNKNYDGSGYPRDNLQGKDIPLLSRILKVVLDFDSVVMSGKREIDAIKELKKNKRHYDPDILSILETNVMESSLAGKTREIMVKDLVIGMVVAKDVVSDGGSLLVREGQEINEVLQKRLRNFAQLDYVKEPISIYI
jgi:response regulator RpfG family c-di-GMP phosphodiesterase